MTTGSGRYERFQVMERMDAPVEVLWLSSDSNYLLAILSDNSMIILNTVSLAVVSRPPSMHWPAFYNPQSWLGLCTDIEHPDYVVTNTRTGYIQWVDPTKWRTFGEVSKWVLDVLTNILLSSMFQKRIHRRATVSIIRSTIGPTFMPFLSHHQ